MKTQLTRRSKGVRFNSDGTYYEDKDCWIITDYTGRWKIVNKDEESQLYIECFHLHTTYWTEGFFWWAKSCKKVKAKVFWVHEDNLALETEHINVCTGGCDE